MQAKFRQYYKKKFLAYSFQQEAEKGLRSKFQEIRLQKA
jgi:hypothetical protein